MQQTGSVIQTEEQWPERLWFVHDAL